MNTIPLSTLRPQSVDCSRVDAVDTETMNAARRIVESVRTHGDGALTGFISDFENRQGDDLILPRPHLKKVFETLPNETRTLLIRTHERIRSFADAQRAQLSNMTVATPGGAAGHSVAAVDHAGCYAPGGRFPLPSSVLMTATTARSAGVTEVTVITPSAQDVMLAAAFIAGADRVLWAGGAHAIAAAAYGTESVSAVDVIVGPGNRWVTAAKAIVSGRVGIDMLAGPSELVVVGGPDAKPSIVAADLLAQAEHDPDARPILVTTDGALIGAVNAAILDQLQTLETAEIAEQALKNGFAVLCDTWDEAVQVVDEIAPEHLELIGQEPEARQDQFRHYGGLFIGESAAEVLGDYGYGPNHVLPTGRTARYAGGLSVFNFLRIRTWMRIDNPGEAQGTVRDAEALARIEGLMGHSRSAALRKVT